MSTGESASPSSDIRTSGHRLGAVEAILARLRMPGAELTEEEAFAEIVAIVCAGRTRFTDTYQKPLG